MCKCKCTINAQVVHPDITLWHAEKYGSLSLRLQQIRTAIASFTLALSKRPFCLSILQNISYLMTYLVSGLHYTHPMTGARGNENVIDDAQSEGCACITHHTRFLRAVQYASWMQQIPVCGSQHLLWCTKWQMLVAYWFEHPSSIRDARASIPSAAHRRHNWHKLPSSLVFGFTGVKCLENESGPVLFHAFPLVFMFFCFGV